MAPPPYCALCGGPFAAPWLYPVSDSSDRGREVHWEFVQKEVMRRRKTLRASQQEDSNRSKPWKSCSVLPGELEVDRMPDKDMVLEEEKKKKEKEEEEEEEEEGESGAQGLKHLLDALLKPLYYDLDACPKEYRPPRLSLPQSWLGEQLQCLAMDIDSGWAFFPREFRYITQVSSS